MTSPVPPESPAAPTAGEKRAAWLLGQRWPLIALLVLSLPISLYGALQAWGSIHNDVTDWLPPDLPATQELFRFVERFGSDELLVIAWPGCTLEDPRIERYKQRLLEPEPTEETEAGYFRAVITGPESLEYFQSSPLSLSREQALRRMRRWIVGDDGRSTCVIALASARGSADRNAAVELAYRAAEETEGLSADELWVAGTTMDGVAIDRASAKNLGLLNLASFGVCLAVLLACQRNARVAGVIFLTALFNEQLSLALIFYTGGELDSVLLLAANLAFVLSISVGVHVVNYYREAIRQGVAHNPMAWAMNVATTPTCLATITTAVGLASLQVSETAPIERFGFYSALTVVISAVNTLILVSLHFSIWPLHEQSQAISGSVALSRWSQAVADWRWPILLASVVVLAFGADGVRHLKTSVAIHDLISPQNRAVTDYQRIESSVGPLVPLEVVLEMPAVDSRSMLGQLRAVAEVHRALQSLDDSYVVISPLTYAPSLPAERAAFGRMAREAVYGLRLEDSKPQLASLGYLQYDARRHDWRLTVRCPANAGPDYGETILRARRLIDEALKKRPGVEVDQVVVGGGVPVVHQTQQQMLKDLVFSFLMAFLLVAITLMAIFRSFAAGLIGMLPNLIPSALTFGVMGFAGWPVELGVILTASAALGIAVDDSMHLITWFRGAAGRGAGRTQAVSEAICHCAPAMVQTTLTCTLGLVVFYFSEFLPIAKFGLCMFAVLSLALAADLAVLPAILHTKIGELFTPRLSGRTD